MLLFESHFPLGIAKGRAFIGREQDELVNYEQELID